jgi:hypothetical protein
MLRAASPTGVPVVFRSFPRFSLSTWAAFIKDLQDELSSPTVKQHLAALRMLFDCSTGDCGRGGDLPQSARHGEDQVAASDLIAFGVQVNGSSGGLGGVKGKRAGKIREASYGSGNSRLLEFS